MKCPHCGHPTLKGDHGSGYCVGSPLGAITRRRLAGIKATLREERDVELETALDDEGRRGPRCEVWRTGGLSCRRVRCVLVHGHFAPHRDRYRHVWVDMAS